ncbi:MAG TPA: nitrilase-related carbon-nitrogen hydrolase [Rhizomicrobium sp.]|nr:nitrilase-related carbon-nitrogen hydrolase [Rhizomicrobium sp.]
MTALFCAALSGAMFYLSQGLDDVWWLAWIAPVPLLWLAYGKVPRWHLRLAAVAAFACGQIYMVQSYWGMLPPVGLALMMFGMGALLAATIRFAQRCWQRLPSLAVLVAFPAAWTSVEFAISLVSPHGSWGALAYSQVSFPPAIQVASLFGLYAITFTLCLFANALALVARGIWKAALPGLAVSALVLAFGWLHLGQPQGETVHAAMLADWDGRLKTTKKLDFAASRAMAEQYAAMARQEADKGARFIVIPETAIAADPIWRDQALAPLAEVAREKDLTIVAGVVLVKPWRNAAFSFLPDGSQRSYDKRHLLPPGEDKFTPGPGAGPLGNGRSVAICKDLDFPRTIRSDALNAEDKGIRLMAVPANDFIEDGWIHARMAVMRGVENGFAVVRSAFNGLETVSDARGRVLARASTVQAGMVKLSAEVPLGPGPTLYTRIGDVFAWLCVAAALGLAVWVFRKQPLQA